ncbi:ankyrin repeat domain-containing protein SOWAHC [Kryptolebias marmoratus]|uniref:ankyrin repeat domain-containing protein SOWAHC n=1 Tax=Kryptolebias marmoratus TaxID=37003 RepID=UPI000D53034B|nr:ankyrin repeat domain-containing protein SOWAHC [Kryptolebias marmoratus]
MNGDLLGVLSKQKGSCLLTPQSSMKKSGSDCSGSEPAVERLSRCGPPGAAQRRSRLLRQQEVGDGAAPERASLTTATRKKYLKELLLSQSSGSGFSFYSSSSPHTPSSSSDTQQEDAEWALDPMEHAWMLSAVEGNYETLLEFISDEPYLLTRRDFISGYSVLHWLSKRGQDETLLKLLRHAEGAGLPVNVNLRGSGGLTPLHVASMHGQFAVVKLLVGAFSADVDAMDYSGRRAWQYLKEDAPPEMKELLGTWDDEHSCGCAQSLNRNCNNNCAGATNPTAAELDPGEPEEPDHLDQTRRGSWRFDSFRKFLTSFSFRGYKT